VRRQGREPRHQLRLRLLVTAAGAIVVARDGLDGPEGIAVDGLGNLVITGGNRVRVVAARTGTFYGRP
jgi:hypothetical protein